MSDVDHRSGRRAAAAWVGWLALASVILLGFSASAGAAQAWRLDSLADSSVAPGETFEYLVQATNTGNTPTDGTEVDLTGTLPRGLTVVSATLYVDPKEDAGPQPVTGDCTAGDGVSPVAGASDVKCVSTPSLPAYYYQLLRLTVTADPTASGTLTSSFAVTGGGDSAANTVDPTQIAPGPPKFGVDTVDGQATDLNGNLVTQAGAHPALDGVSVDFNTYTNPVPIAGAAWPVEPVKDVIVDLPPGLVGDPAAIPTCSATQLVGRGRVASETKCPPSSQVGTVLVRTNNFPLSQPIFGPFPVFNMDPPANAPARLGFNVGGTVVILDATVRSGGDYGITFTSRDISEALPIAGTTFTLWGVPADASHDGERACFDSTPPGIGGPACPSGGALTAFIRNPTSCTAPGVGLETVVSADSWLNPGGFSTASFRNHVAPFYPAAPGDRGPDQELTGCDRVPFDPRLEGQPVDHTPNTPTGFAFDLSMPQSNDPGQIAEADVRSAVVTLPVGVRVNPSAADGLQACSSTQIHLHDAQSADCPTASKIGAVRVTTPLLRDPLEGGIYLAAPHDNPFGTLLSIYLVAEGSGVVIKLAGRVEADPITGQLTTTFDDNPQTPFTNLHLEFDGGARAQLVTPRQCGTQTTNAVLTGWNGAVVNTTSSFDVSGCPAPKFTPTFDVGTASNSAGSSSSLQMRFTRDDLDQELSAVTVNLAPGLTGRIANVDLCSIAAARSDSCPAGSKIGDVTVGAGAGTHPFFITNGRAYLTSGYKGAPFGVAIVVPAVAGPFDLGTVVTLSSLSVDKHDASVRVVSDPLPTILQGIPLQVRDVRINVDRPGFFLNPTSCAEKRITGTLTSTEGTRTAVSDRFQAAECANLGLKPRMVLRVGGRGHTRNGQTSPLSTTLTMPQRGQTNLRFVRVTLPKTINARLNTINDACTRAEFENDISKCGHAIAGSATASTPLLRDPLKGTAYFVKNGHAIPDLFVALRGQVAFDLIGRITIVHNTFLRTTFNAAPDVPIRSFTLRLLGGPSTASIGATTNLCSAKSRRQKAQVDYIGQNGKVRQVNQALQVAGCPKHSRHHRSR